MKVGEALKQMAYATSPMKIAMLQKTIKSGGGMKVLSKINFYECPLIIKKIFYLQ